MPQLVEIRGLSQAEAEERAANFGIDAIQVDTIKEADGTFTVRATYPDGMVVPGATPVSTTPSPGGTQPPAAGGTPAAQGAGPAGATIVSDSAGGFAIKGLTKAAADEEAAFFRDSGSTVDVVAEGATFTVRRCAARGTAGASACARASTAARCCKRAGPRRLCFLS